jgi:hypothetical protein
MLVFILQKDTERGHLGNKENIRTEKSQEPVELTIDLPNLAVRQILE